MTARRPDRIRALLFDVDGVLTDTAAVHAKAWKAAFEAAGYPFELPADYEAYVDGRPRVDGVRTFLGARDPDASEETVQQIAEHKNDLLLELIRRDGVPEFEDAAPFVRAAREAGLKTAVVSSSANAREALRSAGLEDCFDTWVDGVRIDADGLKGKPAPDTFLTAAADLDVEPSAAAVLEDAESGVEAGRAGEFGWVVGVDRTGHADALREHGADVVVTDLSQVEL